MFFSSIATTETDECMSYLNTFSEESKKINEQGKQERDIINE